MAEKKFTGPIQGQDLSALSADYEQADSFDRLRVGKLAVYYRDGFRIKAVPYSRMERAFIRVQQVRGRMCCGETAFLYYRLGALTRDAGKLNNARTIYMLLKSKYPDYADIDAYLSAVNRAINYLT